MKCDYRQGTVDPCASKATLYVGAFGAKAWSGVYCRKHVPVIIKKRIHLVRKYGMNLVVRNVSEMDRKRKMHQRYKELRKQAKGK